MQILDSSEYVTTFIDIHGTAKFENFLDRNFPDWRQKEIFKEKNSGTVEREWLIGIDGVERHAYYRKLYVEIFDDFTDLDENQEAEFHLLKHRICDIDGDLTPIAIWRKPT